MDVPEIGVEELERRLAAGATLIDVREPDEYAQVRVPGGILVPLQTVPDCLADVPTDGTFYVICAKGGRSREAAEFLITEGDIASQRAPPHALGTHPACGLPPPRSDKLRT